MCMNASSLLHGHSLEVQKFVQRMRVIFIYIIVSVTLRCAGYGWAELGHEVYVSCVNSMCDNVIYNFMMA